jgi:hypothetical protein
MNSQWFHHRPAVAIIGFETLRVFGPFRFLLIAVYGWMNLRQLQLIDYLREENRVWSGNIKELCLSRPLLTLPPWRLTIGSVLTGRQTPSVRETETWEYAIRPSTVGRPNRVGPAGLLPCSTPLSLRTVPGTRAPEF